MRVCFDKWELEPSIKEDNTKSGIATVFPVDNDDIQLPIELFDTDLNTLVEGEEYEMSLYFYLEKLFFVAKDEKQFYEYNPQFCSESNISFGIINFDEEDTTFVPTPRTYMNVKVLHITTQEEYPHEDNMLLIEGTCQDVKVNLIIVCNKKEDLPIVAEGNYISGEWWIEAYMEDREEE